MGRSAHTRRELLAASTGTLAGVLALPALARAGRGGQTRPGTVALGDVPRRGVTVELDANADLVGLQWERPAAAAIRLRFRGAGGRWSEWVSAGEAGHGPDVPAAGPVTGEPVWTGGTRTVQLVPDRPLAGARLRTVDVSAGAGARNRARPAASRPLAEPRLDAGAGQPAIWARSAWAGSDSPPAVAPEYGNVELAFVHHTDNPNGYSPGEVPAMVRGIYVFHRFVNGWNDIGYNFLVDLYGGIWEARAGGIDQSVVGAQAGGFNTSSTGVAMLGTFSSVDISSAARRSLEALLSWKLALHGVPSAGEVTVRATRGAQRWSIHRPGERVILPRIAGHRQADLTDCPGNVLFAHLPSVRQTVHGSFPEGARLSAALARPAQQPPTAVREVQGRLARQDGRAIAGARVLVQARDVSRRGERVSERTLATAVTDGGGAWHATVPAARGAAVRALCLDAGGLGATRSPDLALPQVDARINAA
ncbi:MAG TPA: N-acetylmuramoyl-L-alanine amidase [Solirubrobacteraceae bacterium]|nr:N-acetylmuramoyl-L-alanine amidase [Solirubrobacteraceae bacterium]